jgi:hypothetical protein
MSVVHSTLMIHSHSHGENMTIPDIDLKYFENIIKAIDPYGTDNYVAVIQWSDYIYDEWKTFTAQGPLNKYMLNFIRDCFNASEYCGSMKIIAILSEDNRPYMKVYGDRVSW